MIENTCRHGFTFLVFPVSVRPCLFFRKPAYPLPGRANILTAVDKMDKKYNGYRQQYDWLCEVAHPNWSGVLAAYGQLDYEKHSLSLGTKNTRLPIIVGIGSFTASLKLFERHQQLARTTTTSC